MNTETKLQSQIAMYRLLSQALVAQDSIRSDDASYHAARLIELLEAYGIKLRSVREPQD